MTNLEFLKSECYFGIHFEKILSFIRAPSSKTSTPSNYPSPP